MSMEVRYYIPGRGYWRPLFEVRVRILEHSLQIKGVYRWVWP